jgi:hypothetical protein
MGRTSLKLHVELSAKVRGEIGNDYSAQLSALQEFAQKIKASDPRVKYAHPNWIMGIDPSDRGTP